MTPVSFPRRRLFVLGLFGLLSGLVPAQAQNSFGDDTNRATTPPPTASPTSPATNTPPPATNVPPPPPSADWNANAGTTPPAGATAPRFPQPPNAGLPPPPNADSRFAQVEAVESQDFGVPATDQLRQDQFHAPTPTRIPGGLVITTEALNDLYQKQAGAFIVFDVLGGQQGLPGAQNARPAGEGGSFSDQNQRDFGNYLQSVTRGNKQMPLVFYCQSNHCWLSYNAALRAIKLGYTQVLWYRGGIEAWQQAGLPTYGQGGY